MKMLKIMTKYYLNLDKFVVHPILGNVILEY